MVIDVMFCGLNKSRFMFSTKVMGSMGDVGVRVKSALSPSKVITYLYM